VPRLDAHLSGHHTGIRGRVTKEMIPTVIAALGLFLALVAFHSRGYGIGCGLHDPTDYEWPERR
jgi:hypothetical protein